MKCLDDSLLQMYVEGVLDRPEEEIARVHLARCPGCRGKVAEYKQLMWDLEHLAESEIPQELDDLRETLLRTWREQQRERGRIRRPARSLIPAWVGYSVAWTRYAAPLDLVDGLLSWAGRRLLTSRLPFSRRFGGRGGDRR